MRPAIPRLKPPPYPATTNAIAYAEDYRLNYFCKSGDPKGFVSFHHNRYINITATGGKDNYYIVYAYPPAGFWYAGLEELERIEPWRGWILLYDPPNHTYRVIINTKNDGYEAFQTTKQAIGL
jgi:hypothetical protein